MDKPDPDFDGPDHYPILDRASIAMMCGTVLILAVFLLFGVIFHHDPEHASEVFREAVTALSVGMVVIVIVIKSFFDF